jgi:hypothetical protein
MITNLAGTENLTTLDSNLIFFNRKRRIIGLFIQVIHLLVDGYPKKLQSRGCSIRKITPTSNQREGRGSIVCPIQQSVSQSDDQSALPAAACSLLFSVHHFTSNSHCVLLHLSRLYDKKKEICHTEERDSTLHNMLLQRLALSNRAASLASALSNLAASF